MSPEIATHYDALELQPGASPQDVKRAYFRLVRKYTPEKDPERFQKIRAAYECLKDGPVEMHADEYEMPDHPSACLNIERAKAMIEHRRFDAAAKLFQEALEYAPDSPVALLGLASSLNRAGKFQKAAKAAERLIRLRPDDRTAHTLMAQALYARGWYKKALPAFRRAYELGERQTSFLSDYAEDALDNGLNEESVRIAREMLACGKWTRDNHDEALHANLIIAKEGNLRGAALADWLKDFGDFVTRQWRIFESGEEALSPIYHYYDTRETMDDLPDLTAIDRTLDRIGSEVPAWRKEADLLRAMFNDKALGDDPRGLNDDWQLLLGYTMEEKLHRPDGAGHYDLLSAQLCFLKDWAEVSRELPIIRQDYPCVYAICKDFFEKIEAAGPQELFARLRREFERLSKRYEGSVYQKRYPKEFAPAGRVISGGDDATPYVRAATKVGANDPCPCGSGRKFKKCCMGTGKYD